MKEICGVDGDRGLITFLCLANLVLLTSDGLRGGRSAGDGYACRGTPTTWLPESWCSSVMHEITPQSETTGFGMRSVGTNT